MENFQVAILFISVFQPIIAGLLGWVLVKVVNLNREMGTVSNKVENNEKRAELAHDRITELKKEKGVA